MKFNLNATDCVTVLGTRGTGKSSLARRISEIWPRVVIIDPVMDWKGTPEETATDFSQFSEKMNKLKNENTKKFKLIFRFNPETENKEGVFNHVLRLCFHFKNIQVVIDEIQLFSTPQYIPEHLKNLLFIGRHNGISVICITQRPGQLNKSILAQSLHVFCGQLHERNDLRVVSDFINTSQEQIINLKKGSFFHFTPGESIKLIKIF